MRTPLLRPVLGYVGVLCAASLLIWVLVQPARAQTATTRIQEAQTQLGQTNAQRIAQAHSRLDANDLLVAQIWGLSEEEMIRAKVLLKGPRAAFSVENLSPVEALGIHARDDAERQRYAEMFARALQADVERSLAWNRAFQQAQSRLYPNQKVVDFEGLPMVEGPTSAADLLGIPRKLVKDPSRPLAPAKAAPRR